MHHHRRFFVFIASTFLGSTLGYGNEEHRGVIARLSGEVAVYTNPSEQPSGPSPRVQLDGRYYTKMPAKTGLQLGSGDALQTGPKGKVRIIFGNGDSINIGPGTLYRAAWVKENPPVVDLIFGKIRGFILKGGPRAGSQIRSRSAVMGVRGTDFFVETAGKKMTVSVLRGEVVLKDGKEQNPVVVPSGFTAHLTPAASSDKGQIGGAAPSIALNQTTKEEFIAIQANSSLPKAAATGETDPKIVDLESKATANVFKDLEASDPSLFREIKDELKKDASFDSVATLVVKKSFIKAPVGAKAKPSSRELDIDRRDVYEKYFPLDGSEDKP